MDTLTVRIYELHNLCSQKRPQVLYAYNEIIIEAYSCLGAHVKRAPAGLYEIGVLFEIIKFIGN
jgi:hypothetical protein